MPDCIIMEMVPPRGPTRADYDCIVSELEAQGFHVTFANRFPSAAVGDKTDRERWILTAHIGDPIDFTSTLPSVSGSIRDCLVPSHLVPAGAYVRRHDGEPLSLSDLRRPSWPVFDAHSDDNRINYVPDEHAPRTRAILLCEVPWPDLTGKGVRVYSIDGLIVTQTSWCNALILDDRGTRYLLLSECVRIAGLHLDPTLLPFLESVSPKDALHYVANAVTGGVMTHVYAACTDALEASPITTQSHEVSLAPISPMQTQ